MRQGIIILTSLFLMTGCNRRHAVTEATFAEAVDCDKGQMKAAWYECGHDERVPSIKGLSNQFVILVDSSLRATNFVSPFEDYLRWQLTRLDTSSISGTYDDWEKLSTKQKFEKVEQLKILTKVQADSLHLLNNQGQQQVWIINNSKDTVTLEIQDASFMCVLQALTKGGQWCAIQYRPFSSCGNSYTSKDFLPGTANSFITKLPNEGDYKTKLRYKLLGSDKAYYSNVFDGRINYCEFVKDSTIHSGVKM